MSFTLVGKNGNEIKLNAWNWRPRIAFLRAVNLTDDETFERMGSHAGARVDDNQARSIADVLDATLKQMQPGERIRADLIVTDLPRKKVVFTPGMDPNTIHANDAYSATYDWLLAFKEFSSASGGFEVL